MSKNATTAALMNTKGLRPTSRRVRIYDALSRAARPISAEELHTEVRSMNLVTVYRTLERFRDVGLVREVRFKDTTRRFEMAHHGHHHHIVCTNCGIVDELSDCTLALESMALKSTKRFAYIDEHALEFFGTCVSCAKR